MTAPVVPSVENAVFTNPGASLLTWDLEAFSIPFEHERDQHVRSRLLPGFKVDPVIEELTFYDTASEGPSCATVPASKSICCHLI